MTEEIIGTVLKHAEDIVNAVRTLAPDMWAIYVRQQYISGTISTMCFVSFTVMFVWSLHRSCKLYEVSDKEAQFNVSIVLSVIGGLGLIISTAVFLIQGLGQLLNPQYYAIQALIP